MWIKKVSRDSKLFPPIMQLIQVASLDGEIPFHKWNEMQSGGKFEIR